MTNTDALIFDETTPQVVYASFGKRLVAYLIDAVIVFPFTYLVHTLIKDSGAQSLIMTAFIIGYFDLMESGPWQGTVGKKVMGLKITTTSGYPITKKTSAFRLLFKILFSFLFMVGYLPALWTKRKQALYDIIVGTVVVDTKRA